MTVQFGAYSECGEDIREAAAGIMFAAGWCGDLPELLFARTILADKFGGDFAMMAKEGTGVVDPMVTRTRIQDPIHSWSRLIDLELETGML
jgi:hypothetical protein